jgi:hypothetical protein
VGCSNPKERSAIGGSDKVEYRKPQGDVKESVFKRKKIVYPDLDRCAHISNLFVVNNSEHYDTTKKLFDALLISWKKEARQPPVCFSSRTETYLEVSSGQQIIAMGKKALPFVMVQICNGNFFFNVAARRIAGVTMRKKGEFAISEQELALRWTEWWGENCNQPEWNVYLIESP